MAYRRGFRVGMRHTTNASESLHSYIKSTLLMGESYPDVRALIEAMLRLHDERLLLRIYNYVHKFVAAMDKGAFIEQLALYGNNITDTSGVVTFQHGDVVVTATSTPLSCTCVLYSKGAFCAHLYHLFDKGVISPAQLPIEAPRLHVSQAKELYDLLATPTPTINFQSTSGEQYTQRQFSGQTRTNTRKTRSRRMFENRRKDHGPPPS